MHFRQEGTNSEEQETTTEGSDEASLTDAVSGEETESEDEPASQEEADEDAADDENLSEETDNETGDETATSEEVWCFGPRCGDIHKERSPKSC